MSIDYKGVKVPEYADHADGPQAFKDLVDGVLPLAGGTMAGSIIMTRANATHPGFRFDGNEGMYQVERNGLGFAIAGKLRVLINFRGLFVGAGQESTAFVSYLPGSETLPTYAFQSSGPAGLKTGMYFNKAAGGILNFSANGHRRMLMTSTYVAFPGTPGGGGAANAVISLASGNLSTGTSARKYKSNIEPAPHLADLALVPVTFHHDGDNEDYIGFIADDVAAQDRRAGVYGPDGIENYDLRAVVAILSAKVNRLEAASA